MIKADHLPTRRQTAMLTSLRLMAIPALLVGLLGFVSPAPAAKAADSDPFKIQDSGNFFSKEAIDKANKKIAQIKRDFGKDLVIETIAEVSDSARDKVKDEAGKRSYFSNYAKNRYRELGAKGIYVILSKKPQWLEITSGEETNKKAFTSADRKTAREEVFS